MKQTLRWLVLVLLAWVPVAGAYAEKVSDLPAPTGYVNDFAGVLSPSVRQSVENLCTQVDRQAHAQIAVVTIKTIEGDQSIEEFATALEDKWKVGAKGTDRGVLMLCDPRLTAKPYGRIFLASLPAMPRSRELADVQAFFADRLVGAAAAAVATPRGA